MVAGFVIWPAETVLIAAVALSGIGFGLVRGAQVSLAMAIAETDLSHLGTVAVLGSLRALERLGSVIGLLVVAGVAGMANYNMAVSVIAVWTLAGAVLLAVSLLRTSRQVESQS